jgi:hypothetical protein
MDNAPQYTTADEAALKERLSKLEAEIAGMKGRGHALPPGFAPSLPAPLMLLAPAAEAAKRHWLDWAIVREARFIAFMYLDPRYRFSRLGQFGIPGILLAALLNYLVLNYLVITIPFVTPFVERAILLGMGMVLYILLQREAARYRNVLDYLARYHA